MQKGVFLFAPMDSNCVGRFSGVEKKVRAEHAVLQKHFDCALEILPPVRFRGSVFEKIRRRLPFTASWRRWRYRGEYDGLDFLYIRQVQHDDAFARYLRAIRRANPKLRIVYEVPTFCDMANGRITAENFIFEIKERTACRRAAKYMDRIVTFYGQDTIWGVPCLKTLNGYDFSSVTLPARERQGRIHMLSVAANAFWHGYDRVLEGIRLYYANGGQEEIIYHLVGNVLPEYTQAVKDPGLSSHVILHGFLSGAELEAVYRQCLLGFDVLGGHRKDYPVSSSLKSREYAAYGLGIVTSSPIDYLPEDCEYQLCLPYDDTPIDLERVLTFFHRLFGKTDVNAVSARIRKDAEEKCDMDTAMAPVVRWLQAQAKEGGERDALLS